MVGKDVLVIFNMKENIDRCWIIFREFSWCRKFNFNNRFQFDN